MKHFKLIALFVLFFALLFTACKKEDTKITKAIKGVAQKGPFVLGSEVTIFELDENLNQTGRVFSTTTTDKFGNFELPEQEYESQYLELAISGNYYHEYYGDVWPLTTKLRSVVKVSDEGFNINLLTHIENERLKYLVQNEDMSFDDAKEQVRTEVLNIFSIENPNAEFENLDLTGNDENNDILTAISAVYSSGPIIIGSLEEYLNILPSIIEDIKTDGVLNSSEIQSALLSSAKFCSFHDIRNNLTGFYNDTLFNHFQSYVYEFIENTEYSSPYNYTFPDDTEYGENLLNLSHMTVIDPGVNYCYAVEWSDDLKYIDLAFTQTSGSGTFTFTKNYTPMYDWEESSPNMTEPNIYSYRYNLESTIPLMFTFSGHGEGKITIGLIFDGSEFMQFSKTIIW